MEETSHRHRSVIDEVSSFLKEVEAAFGPTPPSTTQPRQRTPPHFHVRQVLLQLDSTKLYIGRTPYTNLGRNSTATGKDQEESAVTDSQVGAHCSGQRCGLKLVKQHHPATVPLQKFPLTESNHELNKHGFLCAERLLHPLTLEQPSCVLAPSNGDCTAPCEPMNEYYSYKKPLCPSGYLYQWGAGHRCYKLFSDTVSYVEAELRCAAEGGSLPNFPEEFFIHAFLLAMVKYEQEELNVSIPRLWVGYKSLPGTMKVYDTVGGEPSLKTQLPLANGEPFVDRGECMGLEGSTIPPYSLASMNCSTTAHFICMVDPEAPKCPYSYILYQGSCYMLVKPKSPVTFPEAEVLCAQEHGRLALESSVLTASFFTSWADLLDASTTWAGLSRTASGWLSSATFNSTFVDMWDASHPQPGTDCAYRNVSSPGVWLSSHCTQPKDAYICLYTPGSKLPYWDHFCPENFTSHMGRCFMFVDEPKTHHEAEVSCAGRGSRLAALNDISTDLFLLTLMRLSSGTEMYIGVDDLETEGSFTDSYFNPWTLLDLNASNTEDLDCVVRREKEATAVDCSELHPFMCEWTAPASQEGFVLELRDGTRHLRLESPPATYKKMKTMCAHRGRTYHLSYPHTPYLHSLTAALLEEGNYTTAWLGRLDWSTKDNGQVPPLPVNTTMPATNNVTGCERAELGNDSMNISSANCLQEEVGICQMDACYSERGHQCIFPFINPNDTQTYVNCSFWHWNIPWCAVEVDSNNVTTRREFCLPDCPAMKPMVLCEDQPPAPPSPANLTFEQGWLRRLQHHLERQHRRGHRHHLRVSGRVCVR
ncbi:uncharacterized protein [Panulirus ornatus]|uniref:uncharacterized protein n=1 Tax=Panulirus ornatus TaxID=150431 RepID=UPI003A8B8241